MDTRHALRSFHRRSGLAAIAIGLLTVVVSLNIGVFRLVDGVFLKPLPVNDSEPVANNGEQRDFSYLIFDQLRFRIGNISSRPLAVSDGREVSNAKSRAQTQPVKAPLVARAYSRGWTAKTITGRQRTSGDDQAAAIEIAGSSDECPFSKALISTTVTLNEKLLVIVSLTPPEAFGEAVESPDEVWKRFDRTNDLAIDRHADDPPVSSALPHQDRSIPARVMRNQICVSLIGKKLEAEDGYQEADNGQTPAPPPERAQERRR